MSSLSDFSGETDKHFIHNTVHVYNSLFAPIKDRVKNVLEIGINTGNSHRMWRDYFTDATIYGIDIENFCNSMDGENRIITLFGDAYSYNMLNILNGIKFDIIIDDGPHTLESQRFFVRNYISLLSDDGILIVEDIPHIEWIQDLTLCLPEELRNYCYGIDRRHSAPKSWFHDEILFVFDKRFI